MIQKTNAALHDKGLYRDERRSDHVGLGERHPGRHDAERGGHRPADRQP